MAAQPVYDSISTTYERARRADPRIAAHIHDGLGDAARVVNIGAGTGNYEPVDRLVVAVEPSAAMIAKRADRTRVVRGVAEHLPFSDGAFDAAMASLTLHHWSDVEAGLAEMRRVAARQVIFLFDPAATREFWGAEYFAEAFVVPSERNAPGPDRVAGVLDVREVRHVSVPFDCTDGFGAAYWGRPEAYLDPVVQQGMSFLALLDDETRERAIDRLRRDLASGAWDERYGELRTLRERDVGYRLLIAGR